MVKGADPVGRMHRLTEYLRCYVLVKSGLAGWVGCGLAASFLLFVLAPDQPAITPQAVLIYGSMLLTPPGWFLWFFLYEWFEKRAQ